MNKLFTKKALYLAIFILVANILANVFYWYTSIFGFDKFMHTLGGVFIVLIVGSTYTSYLKNLKWWQTFVVLTLASFVVGLIWEYYEYIVQFYIKAVRLANIPDSVGDLIFDFLGGAIGSLFVISLLKSYNREDAV